MLFIINGVMSPQLATELTLFVSSCGGDDGASFDGTGDLNGSRSHAACPAVNEHRFALCETRAINEVRPSGKESLGDAGGFRITPAFGDGQTLHGGRGAIGGIATARENGTDAASHREGCDNRHQEPPPFLPPPAP